jgi:hypothetical protein
MRKPVQELPTTEICRVAKFELIRFLRALQRARLHPVLVPPFTTRHLTSMTYASA